MISILFTWQLAKEDEAPPFGHNITQPQLETATCPEFSDGDAESLEYCKLWIGGIFLCCIAITGEGVKPDFLLWQNTEILFSCT